MTSQGRHIGCREYDRGAATISTGTLQIGNGGTVGNIANNATPTFNRSNALAITRNISGTGALIQAGSGVLTLSGTNGYSGSTTVNIGGTLRAASGTAFSSASIFDVEGALDVNSQTVTIAGWTGSGAIALGSGALTINGGTTGTFTGVIAAAAF